MMTYYGFGDASLAGFGVTIERPGELHGQFGLWGRDEEGLSLNYRELRNLVKTVEEEASAGYLTNKDNSTTENCFFKGGSSSKLLHELILHLRKLEMLAGFELHMVHVAGTRMIEQGTDRLSRGAFLEGVVAGQDMLSFVDLMQTACDHHPPLRGFVNLWMEPVVGQAIWLQPKNWFVEGHGIVGGERDLHGVWIPAHVKNERAYVWELPPFIADIAVEECLKSIHKRTNAHHVFLIPRLYSPLWLHMFYKLSVFVFHLSPGNLH
jgi:hypothetical protein